jgi:threonine/homoserine/homoserine lactone efflux protein
MTIESVITFSLAMLILAATPGPGVFASVSQSLSSGFRSSFNVIAGIVAGDILFLLLAIFGLSAIARMLGDLFFIIKICGGAYLIWLGWKMWRADPTASDLNLKNGTRTGYQRFLGGLLITLGNPKVILFYAGFLPTFVDLTCLKFADIILIITLIAVILTGVMSVYSYSAARARRMFTSTRAIRNLNRGAGTVMIGTGVVIATR